MKSAALKRWLKTQGDVLARFVWPGRCTGCSALRRPEEQGAFCEECTAHLMPSPEEALPEYIDEVFSAFCYNEVLKSALRNWKYEGRQAVGRLLTECFAEFVTSCSLEGPAHLVPVPMHRIRLRERGFDQARILASSLAQKTPLRSLNTNALYRLEGLPTQASLGRDERAENAEKAFGRGGGLEGPVWLIDDVLTTGATASACAQILREAGATSITLLTLARTPSSAPL